MNTDNRELCKNIVHQLIVPAICSDGDEIIAVNSFAQKLFPIALVGFSISKLFPEVKFVDHYSKKHFEVVSYDGVVSVDISPLFEFSLWQFTITENSEHKSADIKTSSNYKSEISTILAHIDLLKRNCPDQTSICSAMYRSCCHLLKSASINEADMPPAAVSTTNLSRDVSAFIDDCQGICETLNMDLKQKDFASGIYVTVDSLILSHVLSGALCLCAFDAQNGGSLEVSLTTQKNRAVLTFSTTKTGEKSNNTHLTEKDKVLTVNLLKQNARRLNGMLYTVSDNNFNSVVITIPLTSNFNTFEAPTAPYTGIPATLIQFSGILPSKFYSRLL